MNVGAELGKQVRAWLYLRVSNDPTGRGLSVASQEEALRDWASRENWAIAGVTVDNDLSASRHAKKTRPGYREIHQRMAAGAMDVLACWESSRAQRDVDAYLQTRNLCEQFNVLYAYKGRVYDLSNTSDRFQTGLDALLDERYADEVRDRVLRGVSTRVSSGRPYGKIPFGYRREYDPGTGAILAQLPDPTTAPVVAEMFARVAAGEAIHAIARDLNQRGIPTPQQHRDERRGVQAVHGGWTGSKIRRQLGNPALAGYNVHKGVIVGDGAWEPLVPADQFEYVRKRLADPTRRTQRGVEVKFLLSGILECGVCGARCRRTLNRDRPSYSCHGKNYNNQACVSGRQEPIEEFVQVALIEHFSQDDIMETIAELADTTEQDEALAELRTLEARLREFQDAAMRPNGPSAETVGRMEAEYAVRIADARARATPAWVPAEVTELAAGDAAAVWSKMSLPAKRRVLVSMARIVLNKDDRPRGSRGFNRSRIQIDWR